nr:Nematode fatty acid retinoid binding domain containing protein [Haemonchus contortus]
MIRPIAAIACLCIAFVSSFTFDDVPPEFRELLPEDVKQFVNSLTPEDKKILEEVAKKYGEEKLSDEAGIAAVKAKSPQLGDKLQKIYDDIQKKMQALSPEARAFAKEMYDITRKLHADHVAGRKPSVVEITDLTQKAIDRFKALPKSAQDDLKKEFPTVVHAFTSKKFHKMVARMLINN